jgi:Tol biopolymer transport system component
MNRGEPGKGPAPELKLTPLTFYPGVEDSPAFSPDGSQVAFAWNDPAVGNFDLYVKLAGAGNPVRLTQNELDDRGPAWSPDGKWIAFTRPVPGQAERSRLLLIPALGGAERDLGELLAGAGQSIAWLKSSQSLIFASRGGDAGDAYALDRLDLDTGHRTRLTQPEQGITGDRNPAVSPDGKTLAYLRYLSGSVVAVMYHAELRADGTLGATREIPLPGRGANALAFTPDGRALVFQRGRAGGLWRVPVQGGTPEPIPFASPAGQFPAVSPTAGRLAFSRSLDNANLYLVPRAKPALLPFETSPGADYSARFSPDGTAVVFATDRDGDEQLLIREGDNPPRPLVPPAYLLPGSARWSPDGQRILFDARKEGQSEIYETTPAGGEPRRLTQHPADDVVPFYSSDGASVYFASTRSGRMEIWRMAASASGEPEQITRNGAFFGFLSADGQDLYFTRSRADGQLSRLNLASRQEQTLPLKVNNRGFEVQPDGIYYIDAARRLLWVPLPAGPARTLLEIGADTAMGLSYSKARDALILGRVDARGADLFLVDNFR